LRTGLVGPENDLADIIQVVLQEGQYGHHGYPSSDAIFCQDPQGFEARGYLRRARLNFLAQFVICSCDREGDRRVNLVDLTQNIQVSQHQIALGDDVDRESMLSNHLQSLAGEFALRFDGHIGIIHRSSSDGAFYTFAGQLLPQQLDGVGFNQDVTEVFDLVAGAARIAVNTLVLAAPVQVHVVFQAEPVIRLTDCVQQDLGCDIFYHLDLSGQNEKAVLSYDCVLAPGEEIFPFLEPILQRDM